MRVKMFLGVAAGMLAALSSLHAKECEVIASVEDHQTILIHQDTTDEQGAPRMPVFNPFFAELLSGYVLLGSTSPYGTVDVDITSTAGDSYSTSFDTLDGAIVLPVSGDSGFYSLRITTAAGVQFVGEFTI